MNKNNINSLDKIKKKLFSGSKWAFLIKICTGFITVISNALLSRLLSPNEFGTYFLALSIVSFCTIIGTLGMKQSIVRLISENVARDNFKRVFQSIKLTLIVGLIGAVSVAGIYYVISTYLSYNYFDSPLLISISGLVSGWIIVMAIQNLIAEVYRGFHDIKMASLFGGISALGFVAGLIFVVMLGLIWISTGSSNLTQVLILAIISGITMTILSGSFLLKKIRGFAIPHTKEQHNSDTIKLSELISISWPLLINGITSFFFSNGDIWILSAVDNQENVAIYGSALRLVSLISMPLLIINAVVPPMISEMYTNNQMKSLEKLMRALASLIGIPSFIFLVGIMFYSEEILTLVYGEYYGRGSLILVILCIGQLLNVWAGSCGLVLIYTKYEKVMLLISVVSSVLVIFIGTLAAMNYGMIGLAIVMAMTLTLSNISKLFAVKFLTGIWTHIDLFSNPLNIFKK